MRPLIRKSDVLGLYDGNHAAVARAFTPPLSRVAVRNWPDYVPELRARQLLEIHPELRDFVLDQETGMTPRQMRERLKPTRKSRRKAGAAL